MAPWGKNPTLHWLIHPLIVLCLFADHKGYVYATRLCGPTEEGLQSGGHHPLCHTTWHVSPWGYWASVLLAVG